MVNSKRDVLEFLRELQTYLPLSGFYENKDDSLYMPRSKINQVHINPNLDMEDPSVAAYIAARVAEYDFPEKDVYEARLKRKTHWNSVIEDMPEALATPVVRLVTCFERGWDGTPCIYMVVPQISLSAFVCISAIKQHPTTYVNDDGALTRKPPEVPYFIHTTGEVTHHAPFPDDVKKYAQNILLELLSLSQQRYAEHVRHTVEIIRALKESQ
jgi:hypothetical protein